MSAAICCVDSLTDAIDTVIRTIQMGVPVARCEYVCPASIRTLNAYAKLSLREVHSPFFESHGTEAGVAEQAATVEQIAVEHRGQGFEWVTRPEDRTRLWNARHNALSMDGTCTGEHGVGLHKMGFLREAFGDKGLERMRRVKKALDPDGIFNPGKMFAG